MAGMSVACAGQINDQPALMEARTTSGIASSYWTPLIHELVTPAEAPCTGLEACETVLDAYHHDKSFRIKPYLQRDSTSKVINEQVDQVDRLIFDSFHRIDSMIGKSDVRYSGVRSCLEAAKRFGLIPSDMMGNKSATIDNQSVQEACPSSTVIEGGRSAGKHCCEAMSKFLNLAVRHSSDGSVLIDCGVDTCTSLLARFDVNMHPIIGKGAQGTVYICQGPLADGGAIAVKVLPSLPPNLNLELRMLLFPRHCNVSALLAARIDPTGPRIVVLLAYALAERGTVAAALRSGGAAGYRTVCWWVVQALRGLRHLHSVAGIAHHDVKPDNLLLRGPASGGQLLLCDFGCCVSMGSHCKDAPGTPLYMSPTQARGNFIADHRADVWALGVCAIEAFTGAHPLLHPPPGPAAALDSAPAQLFRVGMLRQAPRLHCPAAPAPAGDGRLAAFLEAALAVVPAARRRQGAAGGGQGGLLDAAGETPDALLARMGDA